MRSNCFKIQDLRLKGIGRAKPRKLLPIGWFENGRSIRESPAAFRALLVRLRQQLRQETDSNNSNNNSQFDAEAMEIYRTCY